MNPQDRLTAILITILDFCGKAGMPHERQEAIYEDIVAHWRRMDDRCPDDLVATIAEIMEREDYGLGGDDEDDDE